MVYPTAARSLLPSESGATSPKRQCVTEVESDGVDLFEETTMEERSSSTGDSRADSPGYSAKYGTYSLLDTSLNRIIDMQLVQSNEVTSSGAMELELKRALKGLEDQKVCVRELVTDRHTQVRKHETKSA
ncbi:hypothetical protein HPB49_003178 [Dermacentor silvarum]|uniref:Uncharacterized protein n=1 Tax=Dermacentor silvarum TaxID=543639 RepID=A0ACB8D2D6_DERSI|nr:hypothetical protein HPB49_003178 [Dermacentor silvarum]